MMKNLALFIGKCYRSSIKRLLLCNGKCSWSSYAKFCSSTNRNLQSSSSSSSASADEQKSTYFITTPIFYVNAAPHIGHMYTVYLADAVARWYRLLGHDVIFTTGTDEHGLKIQQAASSANKKPILYCDEVSKKFKDLFIEANISFTDYIRTTEDRHAKAVQGFWKVLEDKGYIYKGSYEGWYSVSDEAFLQDKDVKDIATSNGHTQKVSAESEQPVVWMKEENYMFKLSEFSGKLSEWYDKKVIYPSKFTANVLKDIEYLPDLSISREKSRLRWGIPVAGDDTQTIYVWLDALVNYLTVIGYPDSVSHWPVNCHVVGKDILRFHAIYWPAFLMAAGLPLPKQILCHSHWLVDSHKMSKSRGNVVDPVDRMKKYTSEGLKFFLLSEGTPQDDGNYVDETAVSVINSHLVNTFANLLSRSSGTIINPRQIFPFLNLNVYTEVIREEDKNMFDKLTELPDIVNNHYKSFNIYRAIQIVFDHLRWANKLFNDHEPWKLVKSTENTDHLNCILHITMETLRVCSILIQPVAPKFCEKVLNKLNIPISERLVDHARTKINFESSAEHKLGIEKSIIMKRLKF